MLAMIRGVLIFSACLLGLYCAGQVRVRNAALEAAHAELEVSRRANAECAAAYREATRAVLEPFD